ncbi:armadillo-type protein [Thelephora terrestris]|uniref:Importin-13 n=1 Tax=Thelephora terrestris TaxID=56493 RepID=A0A9P6H9Q0_9AGAM|nr:armadillo-type protein [Thelephora terrestris]
MDGRGVVPTLSSGDVDTAAQLILQAYSPTMNLSVEDQRRLQVELFEVQKRPEAWGLVIPFLQHPDPNVQFFGAHTIQVKITRDWHVFQALGDLLRLRDLVLDLATYSMLAGQGRSVLRKLFVAITAIALKLSVNRPLAWQNWIVFCINHFSERNISTGNILDFLAIVAEEAETTELLPNQKSALKESISDAVPVVMQAVMSTIEQLSRLPSQQFESALRCFAAWMPSIPASDITPAIPALISLLEPSSGPPPVFNESLFVPASDALQELMTHPPFYDGSGSKSLTEPLLILIEKWGGIIIGGSIQRGFVDPVSHSFCKLLVALGEQSTSYFATNITSRATVSPSGLTKSYLVQAYLRLLLSYTGLPGYAGLDEDESEMTLAFWYLFQESLWTADYHPDFDEDGTGPSGLEGEQATVTQALYLELVQVLRRKVVWPSDSSWPKDQCEKFQVYRRDIGDTLINAYYILRSDLTNYYVGDVIERLQAGPDQRGWDEIEATLHCLMSIQEASPIEDHAELGRLFSTEVLGLFPRSGSPRVRRTAVVLIGSYASWFTTQPQGAINSPSLLMNSIQYVAEALSEPSLCLSAANALRSLCDANRTALAPHLHAFGTLHASLVNIPDTERSKVLQSISSVIQALPPDDEIVPVEVGTIVNPIVTRLFEALHMSPRLPEDARHLAIQQLQALTGVAKGLTRVSDSLLAIDDSAEALEETERLGRAREDARMTGLRDLLMQAITLTVELWSTDASVGDTLSEFIKAMTSLPSDMTLISLPSGPLLKTVCLAARKQLTGAWLSLVSMLVIQLDPPSLLPPRFKTTNEGAQVVISHILPGLLQDSLIFLGRPGVMEENPDVVQGFFSCMESFANHFVASFYHLPPELFNSLMQCSIASLGLQERYSMVSGCGFISAILNKTSSQDELSEARSTLTSNFGRGIMRGILCGLAGVAPRSVIQNLITLLVSLLTRVPGDSRIWARDVLFGSDFVQCKADGGTKEKFLTALTQLSVHHLLWNLN